MEQKDNNSAPSILTRRRVIGLGLAATTTALGIKKVSPEVLEAVGHLLLRESFSIEESSDRVVATVTDVTGFGKALAELTQRRANDSRPFEIRCHKGKYIFEETQDVTIPDVHPEKDKSDGTFQTSVAIVLPENTGLIALDAEVEFELPPSEIGILQQITRDDANVTIDGISFVSKGLVGNKGLAEGGVKAMLLITGTDSPSDRRSVKINNCTFDEQTTYDIYEPFKKYRTDFRSGIVISNIRNFGMDSVRVQDPRWDGVLGINVANMFVDNCRVERNQPERAKIVGSALASTNRRNNVTRFTIKNSRISNFRKCIGAFEGHIIVEADVVQCEQDAAFYIENKPGWVFGGDNFNLDAKRIEARGPMFGSFLIKTGNDPTTYRFSECTFDINNDPQRNDERGFPFRNEQVANGDWNSNVIGVDSAIRLTHPIEDDIKIIAKLTHLPGFTYGVFKDILPEKSILEQTGE